MPEALRALGDEPARLARGGFQTVPGGAVPQAGAGAAPWALAARSEFAQLAPEIQLKLLRLATRRSFGNNEFIYLQDDDAEHLYFVRTGHVRMSYLLEDGSAVLHGILPPGESFGELGVFEGGPHGDMATAVGSVTTLGVPAAGFRALATEHPELGAALGQVIARRYRSYILLTRDLSLKTLPARLAQAILRLADTVGTRIEVAGRRVACIGPVVTQTDLGLMARGSRGNVNRALKTWERAGWVRLSDRSIVILRRDKLDSLSLEEGS